MARWIDKLRTAFSLSKPAQRPAAKPAGNSSHRSYSSYPGRILARYDAVKMTGNRHRRLMDRGTEESEFLPYDREYAITLGRDMHRNQARYVSLENQISRMTAGTVKCQIGTKDRAWNAEAERVFNDRFAKDCLLQIPRTYLSDLCQQLVSSVIREGDVLVVYDDGFARDSGKLLTYEADQLVRMDDADFARLYPGCRQVSGVILDDVDAIYGYIVSHVRITDDMRVRPNGLWILPADKCLVYTTDQAVLLASRYRPGQIRGVPEMLPVSICMDDSDEMIKSELLTAKMGAKNWATIFESEATQTARTDSELTAAIEAQERAGNVDPQTGHLIDPDAVPSAAASASVERPHYSSIDDTDSAIVTYLEGRDRMDIHTPNRPNLHTDEFFRARNADAAASLGLARSHSEMSVQTSYTAFRGESLMTWESIYDRQKKLCRQLLDWLAVKVIERAIAEGELAPATAEARNWRDKITWSLPTMPHIDELRATEAQGAALKAGLATYRDLLGSEWDEKLEQLAREVELIRSLGLPLAITETVSGAPAEPKDNPDNTTDE
jgi:capsid protein